tara:strand:+ start:315 stop:461 length:147 start_codon:yes stop_codon:yes gene_type:complete
MKMFEIISNNTWNKKGIPTNFKYYMKSKSIEEVKEYYKDRDIKSIKEI